ncbi:hypothetical protein [Segatella buccae]|uniref:hypothetical protein n=1 Tax=Segatella buccae TaxID=28126 RepID=UPI003CD0D47F
MTRHARRLLARRAPNQEWKNTPCGGCRCSLRFLRPPLFGFRPLYHADHDFKLPKTDYTILSIDCAVMGLGNSSCGPGVLKKYAIDKKRSHTLRLVVYE